ncbi:MAG: hypothetical protein QXQ13_06740 [Thermoplasmata archaeon]
MTVMAVLAVMGATPDSGAWAWVHSIQMNLKSAVSGITVDSGAWAWVH